MDGGVMNNHEVNGEARDRQIDTRLMLGFDWLHAQDSMAGQQSLFNESGRMLNKLSPVETGPSKPETSAPDMKQTGRLLNKLSAPEFGARKPETGAPELKQAARLLNKIGTPETGAPELKQAARLLNKIGTLETVTG